MKNIFLDTKTSNTIVDIVSSYYGLTPTEIFAYTRKSENKTARQIIHFMCSKYTKKSLSDIGKLSLLFGRLKQHHHSSVLHSIKTVKNLYDTDKYFKSNIDEIEIIHKQRTDNMTLEDLNDLQQKEIVGYFEQELSKKDMKILELNGTIKLINRNLSNTTENTDLKQLMLMDKSVIDNFCETRLKPFLKMLKSSVTNEDLIKNQRLLRANKNVK